MWPKVEYYYHILSDFVLQTHGHPESETMLLVQSISNVSNVSRCETKDAHQSIMYIQGRSDQPNKIFEIKLRSEREFGKSD